ncbi:MAG: tetratricopeptide repeat protein [Armatimonadetes bacterium]|nr:tetratricopeptide repeat protein [Armatimonadota bacterium]
MRMLWRWPAWLSAALIAGLLWAGRWSACGEEETEKRAPISVVLFDVAFETMPAETNLDEFRALLNKGLAEALRAGGYEPMAFNEESPSVQRALSREGTLKYEDVVHPEREASARRIAAVYGARYVLFPRLVESTLALDSGQGRVQLQIRVVPNIGAVQVIEGSGTGQVKVDKRGRALAARILEQAVTAAGREAARALAALGSGAPANAVPDEAETYYTQAMRSLQEDRLDLVVPLLERATRLDPQNATYAIALADAYQRAGDAASAVIEYRRAVTIQPMSIDLRVRLARVYLQRSMLREASAELKRASRIDPNHPELRSTLVDIYLTNGMLDEAAAEYRRMIQAQPDDADLRLKLGDLLLRRGQLEEAQKEYQEAARLDAENPVPHEKLAALYRRRQMHREALHELLLAQRTPAGAGDGERYRQIASALDAEAQSLLAEASRIAAERKEEKLTREEAYAAVKDLSARADALTAEMADLKAPAELADAHRRRVFAFSLLTQCLFGYQSFYESDRPVEGSSAALLHTQAMKELQRAQEATGAS